MPFVADAFIFGFIQGFVVGPVTLYGIQEGLNPKKGPREQMKVIAGAIIVDIFYLMLAVYGVAHFIDHSWVKLLMWTGAAFMLVHMGLNSLHENGKATIQHMHRHKLKFYDSDFVKGIFLCLFNPLAIVFSVMVVGSLYATYQGGAGPMPFALNIELGGILTSTLFILLTFFLSHIFNRQMLKKIVKGGSFILIGYGVYFGWKAVMEAQPVIALIGTHLSR